MKLYYQDDWVRIYHADNKDVLPLLTDVDSCVTDPPYGLSFMGKSWDYDVPQKDTWEMVLNALKPGAHLLSFFGSRTYHRGVVNIEDAGFEIRDQIMWVYGSGFPKSMDISKAIDKMAGAEREIISDNPNCRPNCAGKQTRAMSAPITVQPITSPSTPAAIQWQGWGTALKPAHEPICVARKPLIGTVAQNVLEYGTGGININACRVPLNGEFPPTGSAKRVFKNNKWNEETTYGENTETSPLGRFPANLIHDGSDEVLACFPKNAEGCKPHIVNASDETAQANKLKGWGSVSVPKNKFAGFDDSGSAARFFYCAKASKRERDAGCEELPEIEATEMTGRKEESAGLLRVREDGTIGENAFAGKSAQSRNNHPTVKPIALMKFLIKLVTPPGGIILDPFGGSGSTAVAARELGFRCILIERDENSCEITAKRCSQIMQLSLAQRGQA